MNAAVVEPGTSAEIPSLDLSPDLYAELRRIARRHLGFDRQNHTLQPTALVHEAYLKLARVRAFTDEVHLLALASRIMRQVLVDYARGKSTRKRFGECIGVPMDDAIAAAPPPSGLGITELVELSDALDALSQESSRVARLVEMCYFGGMTAEEAAAALGISVHMARHDLRFGQAWLRRRLRQGC